MTPESYKLAHSSVAKTPKVFFQNCSTVTFVNQVISVIVQIFFFYNIHRSKTCSDLWDCNIANVTVQSDLLLPELRPRLGEVGSEIACIPAAADETIEQ